MTKSNRNNKIALISCYLIASVVIIAIAVYLLGISDADKWFTCFSIVITLTAIVQFFALRRYCRFPDLSCIFIIFTYMFHFGIIINKGFFKFFKPVNDLYYSYGLQFEPFKITALYCLLSVIMLGLGMLVVGKKRIKIVGGAHQKASKQPLVFGWLLILLGVPFLIKAFYSSVMAYLGDAYGATFGQMGDGSGLTSFFSNFVYTGIACLIVYYSSVDRDKSKIFLILAIIVQIIYILFTGGRGIKLLKLVVLLLIGYYKKIFKITKFRLVLLLMLGYVAIVVMNTIADIRSYDHTDYLSAFFLAFGKNLNGNALFDILQETGGSIYTPYLCIVQKGEVYNLAYGKTYFLSLSALLPNIGGVTTDLVNNASFVKSLIGSALGGSFIGEAYFNFGFCGFLVCGIIGMMVYKISCGFCNAAKSNNYVRIAFLFPIVSHVLWWCRDSILGFIRPFGWGFVVITVLWCVSKLFVSYKKTKEPSVIASRT